MSEPLIGRGMDDSALSRPIETGSVSRDQSMVIYLGLFLLLLVFFILLSTMSQQHKGRASAAVESLVVTFGHEPVAAPTGPEASVPGSARAVVADRIGRLVEDWSQRLPIAARHAGERIQFSLPVSAVFVRADGAALQADADAFLADLAARIRDSSGDVAMTLEVVVGGTIIGGWGPDTPPPLPLARAASLARTLGEHGLGSAALETGVEVVETPRVRIILRMTDGEGADARH